MVSNLINQFQDRKPLLINIAFYLAVSLLVALVLSYLIFAYEIFNLNQRISELDQMLLVYGTEEQRIAENLVLDYRKKLNDFTTLVSSHRISSNVFNFIEEKTLPNVWFANFSVSETKNSINLSGEAENMEILSSQVRIFEMSKDYVSSIDILNSQMSPEGRAKFILNLSLNPNIFNYDPNIFLEPQAGTQASIN